MTARKLATVTPIGNAPKLTKVRTPRKYTRLTPEGNAKLDAELRAMIDEGACSKADYTRTATRFNVSVRTVEGRLAKLRDGEPLAGAAQRRSRNELPEDVLITIAAHGQVRKAWADLKKAGKYDGALSTFYRQVERENGHRTVRGITRDVLHVRRGTFERTDKALFMQGFSVDLFYLRAPLAGGAAGDKPVGALVREASTGTIVMSWAWPTDQVTAGDVATLLAEAFRGRVFFHDGEAVFVGGLPDFLRCDNGGQFTARQLGDLLNPLGVRTITSNSKRSYENGAHETVHGLLRKELLAKMPGSEDGHRDHRGELLPDDRPLWTLQQVRDLLDRWAWAFNTRDDGDGCRLDAWVEQVELSDGVLPVTAMPASLAGYAIERDRSAKVYADGVLVDTHYYTCPELDDLSHKRFFVRQWLRDERTIELYTPAGKYVGVAARNGALTAAESGALVVTAGEAERRVKEIIAEAREKHPEPDLPDVPVAASHPFTDAHDTETESERADAEVDGVSAAGPSGDSAGPGSALAAALRKSSASKKKGDES